MFGFEDAFFDDAVLAVLVKLKPACVPVDQYLKWAKVFNQLLLVVVAVCRYAVLHASDQRLLLVAWQKHNVHGAEICAKLGAGKHDLAPVNALEPAVLAIIVYSLLRRDVRGEKFRKVFLRAVTHFHFSVCLLSIDGVDVLCVPFDEFGVVFQLSCDVVHDSPSHHKMIIF